MAETEERPPRPAPEPQAERPRRGHTILGRLAQAVREQNWFAVALELAIVVAGVVIGFQVTSWGNERAARTEEQELLQGLRAEFEELGTGIEAQIEIHRYVERAVATALEALVQARRAGDSSGTIADSTLAWIYVPSTTQLSQGILDGTLGSGRLSLIRDRELQVALSEWEGVLAEVKEEEEWSRDYVLFHLDPILWSRMDVSPFRNSVHRQYRGVRPQAEVEAASDVPADSETIGVLTGRLHLMQHMLREFRGPQREAQRIIALIDRSLGIGHGETGDA